MMGFVTQRTRISMKFRKALLSALNEPPKKYQKERMKLWAKFFGSRSGSDITTVSEGRGIFGAKTFVISKLQSIRKDDAVTLEKWVWL